MTARKSAAKSGKTNKDPAPPPTKTPSDVAVAGDIPLVEKAKSAKHVPAALPFDIDDLEVGTIIEKFKTEVRITTPIAGGAKRVFSGATYDDAIADIHKFMRGESLTLDTASPQEKAAVAEANEANVAAMKSTAGTTRAQRRAAAKAARAANPRSKSGAKRK